jgi:predicted Zn-dependent protease
MQSLTQKLQIFLFLLLPLSMVAQGNLRDIRLGEQGVEEMKNTIGFYNHPQADSLVTRVGNYLVADFTDGFQYEFFILDTHLPNAFALPGGKVFVTRGLLLLTRNEDELAGVIGHEIIHTHKRHGRKQQRAGIFSGIIALPGAIIGGIFRGPAGQAVASPFLRGSDYLSGQYSQKHEKEADKLGAALALQKGYNPMALAEFLTRLSTFSALIFGEEESRDYFSSHPYTPDRVKRIQAATKNVSLANKYPTEEPYLRVIEGIIYGDNPERGYIADGFFYHPEMKLKLEVPENFEMQARVNSVTFVKQDQNEFIVIERLLKEESAKKYAEKVEIDLQKMTNTEAKTSTFDWYGRKAYQVVFDNLSDKAAAYKLESIVIPGEKTEVIVIHTFYKKNNGIVGHTLSTVMPATRKDMPATDVLRMKVVKTKGGETLVNWLNGETQETIKMNEVINDLSADANFEEGRVLKMLVTKIYRP